MITVIYHCLPKQSSPSLPPPSNLPNFKMIPYEVSMLGRETEWPRNRSWASWFSQTSATGLIRRQSIWKETASHGIFIMVFITEHISGAWSDKPAFRLNHLFFKKCLVRSDAFSSHVVLRPNTFMTTWWLFGQFEKTPRHLSLLCLEMLHNAYVMPMYKLLLNKHITIYLRFLQNTTKCAFNKIILPRH